MTLASVIGLSAGWLIAGAIAAGLVIAAHVVGVRRGRLTPLPTASLLIAGRRRSSGRRRLRDALLLTLRVLAIACIALAFDRPSWSGPATAPGESARRVALVIDASASMTRRHAGATLFESAIARAKTLLDGLNPQRDLAGVIFAGVRPAPALPTLSGNLDAIRAALDRAEPTWERADLAGAVQAARALRAPGDASEASPVVIVITDGQASHWPDERPPDPSAPVLIERVGPGVATRNLGVTAISAETPPGDVEGDLEIVATLLNAGPLDESVEVTLDVQGEALRRSPVTVRAESTTTVRWSLTRAERGAASAFSVRLPRDGFEPDDVAHGVFPSASARRIDISAATSQDDLRNATSYIAAAIAAAFGPEALTFDPDDAVDVRISLGGEEPAFLQSGAPALIVFTQGGGAPTASELHVELGAAELFDQLTPGLSRALEGMPVRTAGALERLDGDVPLLRDEEGRLVAALRGGPDPRVDLTLDLSPGAASTVADPAFPALLATLVRLIDPELTTQPAFVGEPIRIDLGRAFPVDEAAVLTDSRGLIAVEAPGPGPQSGARDLTLDPMARPGVVAARDPSGALRAAVSVNVDPRESDMRVLPDVARTSPPDAPAQANTLTGIREQTPLWPALLITGASLLFLERALASAGAGGRGHA